MEARKNPEYLRSVAQAVQEFRDALVEFLELHEVNDFLARGTAPAVFPIDGATPDEIARRAAKADHAAGRAAAATMLANLMMHVQGVGAVDPIANWQTITKPKPLLEADDILGACNRALGRLDGLIMQAEAERPPTIGAEAMHPAVWGPAARLWNDGYRRAAVTAAAESLALMVKARTGRNDVSETSLWKEAFSNKDPEPGKPRLRWPGDPNDRNVSTMNDGLRQFAPGVQMTIRNTATHDLGELDEQAALERLSTLSLLARWLDECELVEAPGDTRGVDESG